ncbi:hypothetical protein M128_1343 [Bacteroides fragilis str. S6L8]|nr:hypothetical protein M126_1189 [Bacteroides fragilis str. S6L3]EYA10456.1 hypothetical protein M130_1265 [Bacteroides fragilis str. S6R6]EYB01403.1 hypothetical protein M128_1343 [Bacteroides fragilis str. S6L8]EYB06188.1 hypothetical protein M129_1210 [Bacteroides fragilis str. S6R5]EYE55193.1 hypothetical protein M127_1289 [Bacteroides fragilis str. S6L5]
MIESMISRKCDCRISIFQEKMKARKQDCNMETKKAIWLD